MADDQQLLEARHAADLPGEVGAALVIHILRGFVKEGDGRAGERFQQRQPHGEGGAHLLAAAQLGEVALIGPAPDGDVVVVLPRQRRRAVAHDLAKDAVGRRRGSRAAGRA